MTAAPAPPAKAAEITLARLGKRYGTTWAVRGVTLTVAPGEFFTLLGPSGCGKTTVLRTIAGFLDPDEGSVTIDGKSAAGVPPWRRDLGLVFQSYALWPHLDVFEHVAFGLRERRVPKPDIRERVEATLHLVGLGGYAGRRPSQLSGGQQQRVALARTLVLRPKALLLDEPLSNLDAALRAQMRVELRRLHGELGITTLYVTHDQEEAMALSTRLAVFDRGAVIQVGTPAEVYRHPRTRFVAEFLGAANLLPGVLERGPAGAQVKLDAGPTLVLGGTSALAVGPVFCLVRPEAVQLGETQLTAMGRQGSVVAAGPNRFFAKVVSSVYLGGRWDCDVELAAGLRVRANLSTTGGRGAPKPGDTVAVGIAPEDLIVLAR
ncbi:MAG: ABC transporter ATP-binding protein [Candidatus Rokubacteria bacterium]|nr:ABC transporter ATP-binding protein [Candidatus Rokubacteria bacterium]